MIAFNDTDDLIVNTVAIQTLDQITAEETVGISSNNGNILLNVGGTLDINQQLDSGTADIGIATNGTIEQTVDGVITSDRLSVRQQLPGADVLLDDGNDVNTAALSNPGTGKIALNDVDDLTIGQVTALAAGNLSVAATTGATTTNADIFINAGGSLTLDAAIDSGTANTYLMAAGDVTQSTSGTITSARLGVRQAATIGNVILDDDNDVDLVATQNAATGGVIAFRDIDDLIIDTVAAANCGNIDFAETVGVMTTSGDILLDVATDLTINQQLNAGTADTRIITNGDVTQSATGIITADELGIRQQSTATGTVLLDDDNDVNSVAVLNNNPASPIVLNDIDDLLVNTVTTQTIGNITFAVTHGIRSTDGDLLLHAGGPLTLDQQFNAGSADARIIADGAISQSSNGTITATNLGIRQESTVGDVSLGAAPNDTDVIAVSNAAEGGDIAFFDVDDLIIDEVVAQTIGNIAFTTTTGIDTNAGDINVTAETDLIITKNVDAAHESLTTSIDESITLISRNGNFTLADTIVITSDENQAPGESDDITGDAVTIVAGSSGGIGVVSLGSDIEIRTDGGVAKQIAPRPTAFAAAPTTGAENAFVTLSDAASMRSNLTFLTEGFLGILELVFGVAGEENLEVVIDWGVILLTDLTASGPAGNATELLTAPGTFEFDLTDGDKTIFYIDTGGAEYLIPHIFEVADLVTTPNDRNGREDNPNIIGVRFSVAQHSSINIWGNSATDPAGAPDTPPPAFSAPVGVTDATGIAQQTAGLALLSSTDTNPLHDFHQESAQLPFANNVATPTGRPEGKAEWEFIAGPSPGVVLVEPTERPTLDIPKIEAPPPPLVVSAIIGNLDFGAGASSDAAIGTDVYLQIRRYFEVDADAEIVIARINDNTIISNRENFEAFVADHAELQDGAGYEVWLITETSGQRVERPIVKFEITGGRPGPATEELPNTFEPYELKELEFEQPMQDGETPVENIPEGDATSAAIPVDDKDAAADETADTDIPADPRDMNDAAALTLLVPSLAFTRAARWRRQQQQPGRGLSRAARTVRRMNGSRNEVESVESGCRE